MNIYTNNPEGCSKCSGGYKGRVGIYEIFVMSERLAMMIMQGANSLEIAKAAEEEGMVPLRKSGLKKVAKGITSLQEVLRVTSG
jgi:type IV pilus assembly protein PilB